MIKSAHGENDIRWEMEVRGLLPHVGRCEAEKEEHTPEEGPESG